MDLIKVFVLDGTPYTIDTIWENDEPLYKANDLAKVLGIKNVNTSISDEDTVVRPTDTSDGMVTVVKEQAAYGLVMKSRRPLAQTFQRWMCTAARTKRTPEVRHEDADAE